MRQCIDSTVPRNARGPSVEQQETGGADPAASFPKQKVRVAATTRTFNGKRQL